MIIELKKFVETYKPTSFGKVLKSNPKLKKIITDFQTLQNIKTLSEALYCLYHETIPERCFCGNRKKYRNFVFGYWQSCGSKNCSNKSKSETNLLYFKNHPTVMKEANTKTQQTLLKRYGVINASQLENVKQKKVETSLKNYSVKYPTQSEQIKEQTKQTCLEKYGVDNPKKSEFFKEKGKQTCLEKYGVENACESIIVKEKIKQTCLKKYGVEFTSQIHISQESYKILNDINLFKENLLKNNPSSLAKKLGVEKTIIYDRHKKYNLNIITPQSSSYESEIKNWLSFNNIKFEANTKKIISPFELDIFIPNYKLAIEFNGLYWHSESNIKDKNYHYNKTNLCNEKGIRLIHIFEDEWLHKKEICLDLLSRFLCLPMKKIMARKCDIKEITNIECRDFLNENHLQGYASASINLGLFYENKLVQLLTFRHSRYNKHIEWENIRNCNLCGNQIIGGMQRLWKYFINKYNPKSVISYCDRRWFYGETYKKLNFQLKRINIPQYNYTDYEIRWHRSHFTKQKCIKLAKTLNIIPIKQLEKMTEKQIALGILNLNRIWDSGQTVWIYQNSSNLNDDL